MQSCPWGAEYCRFCTLIYEVLDNSSVAVPSSIKNRSLTYEEIIYIKSNITFSSYQSINKSFNPKQVRICKMNPPYILLYLSLPFLYWRTNCLSKQIKGFKELEVPKIHMLVLPRLNVNIQLSLDHRELVSPMCIICIYCFVC